MSSGRAGFDEAAAALACGTGVEDPADGVRSAGGRLVPAGIPSWIEAM
jgi:hypothetical protein